MQPCEVFLRPVYFVSILMSCCAKLSLYKQELIAMLAKTGQSFQRILRIRILWLLVPAIIGICLRPVQSIAQTDEIEAQLRDRISTFWQAMQDSDYDKASTFVHPDSRKAFSKTARARVIRWSIKKLEFSEDKTSCKATMIVRRVAAALAAEIDWTLNNQWVLSDGQWYFKIPWGENENPLFQIFKEQQKVSSKASEATKTATAEPALEQPSVQAGNPRDLARALQRLTPDPTNPRYVQNGEKARFRYSVSNTGDEPISVLAADADCHCTSVRKDDSEIPPGKTGVVEIVLDTFGLPLGRINKSVSVQFSDIDKPITLKLQVDSLPNYKISPASMDFGAVAKGERVERIIKLNNASNKIVKIISKSNSDPNLSFVVDKGVIDPGAEATISVRYQSKTAGEFLDNITLETDLSAEPIINIPIKGSVKP
jgi:hypothetical protein